MSGKLLSSKSTHETKRELMKGRAAGEAGAAAAAGRLAGRQAGKKSGERGQKRRSEKKKLHMPELETLMVGCTWQAKQSPKKKKKGLR
jgi:hypothetical protein